MMRGFVLVSANDEGSVSEEEEFLDYLFTITTSVRSIASSLEEISAALDSLLLEIQGKEDLQ
jgi:hypothetical protein